MALVVYQCSGTACDTTTSPPPDQLYASSNSGGAWSLLTVPSGGSSILSYIAWTSDAMAIVASNSGTSPDYNVLVSIAGGPLSVVTPNGQLAGTRLVYVLQFGATAKSMYIGFALDYGPIPAANILQSSDDGAHWSAPSFASGSDTIKLINVTAGTELIAGEDMTTHTILWSADNRVSWQATPATPSGYTYAGGEAFVAGDGTLFVTWHQGDIPPSGIDVLYKVSPGGQQWKIVTGV